jgi:hypothetical protein
MDTNGYRNGYQACGRAAAARHSSNAATARGYRRLLARLEDLADLADAERALREFEASGEKAIPWEQARRELGLEQGVAYREARRGTCGASAWATTGCGTKCATTCWSCWSSDLARAAAHPDPALALTCSGR